MIDIHTHILPLLDDGSSSVEHSLDMINECVRQGVTDVILTPHHRRPYIHNTTSVKDCFEDFKNIIKEQNIPINVYLGQEIYVGDDIKGKVCNQKVLTINDTKYLLLEFDYNDEQEISEVVYELSRSGYKPIVAHVERYTYVDEQDVYEIRESGGLIQVNAQSLVGDTDRRKRKIARKLLKEGLIDFVASDMHHQRTNYMQKAYNFVKKKYGFDTAERLCNLNAKEIIKG